MSDASLARSCRPIIGLLWTQFAPYHVDRITAAAQRMAGRRDVLAVEVASTSSTYAWSPSSDVADARKRTLFKDQRYEDVPLWSRFRAQFAALRHCEVVFIGISYAEPDIIALSIALRGVGVRVVMMTESKFDDMPRLLSRELIKSVLLSPYSAAIVGGTRHEAYVRMLGFRRRRVLTGYDTVDTSRVLTQGGGLAAPDGVPWEERGFVFVGRFVTKKNIPFLIDGFRRYVDLAVRPPRKLVLVGSGEEEAAIRARIVALGLETLVHLPGFLQADGVTQALAAGLALVLPSSEEQWGLVVNEALAFNLPVIVSESVGSRDLLVRNLVNGYVIEHDSTEGLALALLSLAEDEPAWRRMVAASSERSLLGGTRRFADAVEVIAMVDAEDATLQPG